MPLPVNRFLLFIDTETSGLPKKLEAPDPQKDDWPYALQVSWIVYSPEGEKVREENHYIYDEAVQITPSSFRVHGITKDFLRENGKERHTIMQLLQAHLLQYQPLVVGHFVELDQYLAIAEFYRSGLSNPLEQLPVFCTMTNTTQLVRNPVHKYLKLAQLYELLFDREQPRQHHALADAQATADCFFELLHKGYISEQAIETQKPAVESIPNKTKQRRPNSVLTRLLTIFAATVH